MIGLTGEDLDRLAPLGRVDRVVKNEIVPLDGPASVVVLDGFFRLFRNAAYVRDVTLCFASRGDALAPGALFDDGSAESGAVALNPGHVLWIAPEAFDAAAREDPSLYLRLAAGVGRRNYLLLKKLEKWSRAGVEARVADGLLDLVPYATPVPAGLKLDLPISQEDLATFAGTTRETCSSTIADFARRGLVKGGRLKGMILLDLPALQELAEVAAIE